LQELRRAVAGLLRRVFKGHQRMPIVPHDRPEVACPLEALLSIANLHAGGVQVHHFRGEHQTLGQFVQRLQEFCPGENPVARRLPGQEQAMPRQLPLLTMKRNVVHILGRRHVSHQARSGQPAGNHLRRLGGQDDDRFAQAGRVERLRLIGGDDRRRIILRDLATAVFQLHVTQHVQGGRLPLQLFGHLAANQLQVAFAAERFFLGRAQVVDHFHALQFIRQPPTTVGRLLGTRAGGRRGWRRRRQLRRRLFGDVEQRQLPRVEALTGAASEPTQKQVHAMLQVFDPSVALPQLLEQLRDQRLEQCHVLRQQVGIDRQRVVRAHASSYALSSERFRARRRIHRESFHHRAQPESQADTAASGRR
jgi:hypothetical protein